MLGEFYFPHPHYFRESEAPMGVWRYSQQIKIDVEDRFGIMKGLYSIKRIYDRGTYKTLQGPTPCFIMPRSGAWVKHSEIRFLTSPNYFLIQYWGERKGVGKVGGRGFCFLPHQTDEVVKEIKAAMDLLKERYDKWKYKEDLENAPDNS